MEWRIKELMEVFRQGNQAKPIKVIKKGDMLFITNGKHRFEAAKRLKLPIYYMQELFV
jgi:ParB-like chromosome segregation protein Spo0J